MSIMLARGDITKLAVDAVTNAANASLLGGGGVDGAIHRAAGPRLREHCLRLGGCRVGEAKATPAFDLPAQWAIHTVGPHWRGGDHGEEELLTQCYTSVLQVALNLGARTLSLPSISTGVYGFPKQRAAELALDALSGTDLSVTVVAHDPEVHQAYEALLGPVALVDSTGLASDEDFDARPELTRFTLAAGEVRGRDSVLVSLEGCPHPALVVVRNGVESRQAIDVGAEVVLTQRWRVESVTDGSVVLTRV